MRVHLCHCSSRSCIGGNRSTAKHLKLSRLLRRPTETQTRCNLAESLCVFSYSPKRAHAPQHSSMAALRHSAPCCLHTSRVKAPAAWVAMCEIRAEHHGFMCRANLEQMCIMMQCPCSLCFGTDHFDVAVQCEVPEADDLTGPHDIASQRSR